MDEQTTYTISNKQYTQHQLTLGQDMKIYDILFNKNIKGLENLFDQPIGEIISLLLKEKILIKILQVILACVDDEGYIVTEPELLSMSNDMLRRIIEDFFSLNKNVMTMFSSFVSKSVGMNTIST